MQYQFRPISQWPGLPTAARQYSRFKAGYQATLQLLATELEHLKATDFIIEIAAPDRDIRLDGMLRSDASVTAPGVIVSFNSKHGPLRYPCDAFTDWQSNLRAIALALEHLRTVDRYGVTKRGEQYRGWKQLPAEGELTVQQAANVITSLGGGSTEDTMRLPEYFQDAYRRAAKACHPDMHPNRGDDFQRLQNAVGVLKRHHGV